MIEGRFLVKRIPGGGGGGGRADSHRLNSDCCFVFRGIVGQLDFNVMPNQLK